MVGRIRDARERRPSAVRTFLIADIRGYTRFTAELGDEAGSRLATKFAQLMAEGIEAWGGTLVELRGDEALCVFDSARQALRAAVELQDAFADEMRASRTCRWRWASVSTQARRCRLATATAARPSTLPHGCARWPAPARFAPPRAWCT